MISYATDTHALIWYLEAHPRLGGAARAVLQDADAGRAQVYVSAISLIEMVLLAERGKVPPRVLPETISRINTSGGGFVLVPVEISVAMAFQRIPRASVPEMPDRLIAATALAFSVPLITCDHVIVSSGVVPTVW